MNNIYGIFNDRWKEKYNLNNLDDKIKYKILDILKFESESSKYKWKIIKKCDKYVSYSGYVEDKRYYVIKSYNELDETPQNILKILIHYKKYLAINKKIKNIILLDSENFSKQLRSIKILYFGKKLEYEIINDNYTVITENNIAIHAYFNKNNTDNYIYQSWIIKPKHGDFTKSKVVCITMFKTKDKRDIAESPKNTLTLEALIPKNNDYKYINEKFLDEIDNYIKKEKINIELPNSDEIFAASINHEKKTPLNNIISIENRWTNI